MHILKRREFIKQSAAVTALAGTQLSAAGEPGAEKALDGETLKPPKNIGKV